MSATVPRVTEAEMHHVNALRKLLGSRAALARMLGLRAGELDGAVCWNRPRAIVRLRGALAKAWPVWARGQA